MLRSPIIVAALVILLTGLTGVACSKKDGGEAKPTEGEASSPDAVEADTGAAVEKAKSKQAALAEKAKARAAARKAAKEAKEARQAGAAGQVEPGAEPVEGEPRVAGTPSIVTPAEAAAARAAASGDHPLPPPNATGQALVGRDEAAPSVPPQPPAPAPQATAVAQATPPTSGGGVEIVVRDDEPLDLAKLVTLADVQKVVKRGSLKQSEPLAGSLPARDYNGVRFFASQNETLGVAVQVWRFPTTIDARRRYDLYSSRYPNAEKTDAVATQGFFAQSGDVLYLGFLDQAKKAVTVVSCSEDTCDMKDLYVLARELQKKL